MRWPWKRRQSNDELVVSWSGKTFAFLRGRANSDGGFEVRQFGVLQQGDEAMDDFVARLQGLGLKGYPASGMLRPEQFQILQIDAPKVAPDELRSAARYQIRDMLDTHVDDITLDIMRVGDGSEKSGAHLFVISATNAVVRSMLDLAGSMQWDMTVIDIQETAQRNLQNVLAKQDGRPERATAALVLVDSHQAVLTISANDELYYTRRLELPEGFLDGPWVSSAQAEPAGADGYEPVQEYVPDYNVGGVSHGADYTQTHTQTHAFSTANGGAGGGQTGQGAGSVDMAAYDRAQRFLVEVQRSLDLWDRSWSSMPLAGVRVFAGDRSVELAQWLGQELGQTVLTLDVAALFPGFEGGTPQERALCWPLLGVLLRTEGRKL
jgi:MSHA biogenesis protein MshI